MEITEIRIVLKTEGPLRAFVTITLDNSLAIRDMKIIEGPKGLFVAMPSKKLKDGMYRDIVHPVNAETRAKIEQKVLAEYQRVIGKAT